MAIPFGYILLIAVPTDEDYIVIRIAGGRPDTCWLLDGFQCLPFVTTLEFTVDSVIGMGESSWGAIKMIHRWRSTREKG